MGGLFAQFSRDTDDKYVVDEAAARLMPAVQMAINRINDKTDGVYDELLPKTRVRCTEHVLLLGAIIICATTLRV